MDHKNPFARERFTLMKIAVNLGVVGLFLATWGLFWSTNHSGADEPPPATPIPTPATPGGTGTPGPTASPTEPRPTAAATATKTGRAS